MLIVAKFVPRLLGWVSLVPIVTDVARAEAWVAGGDFVSLARIGAESDSPRLDLTEAKQDGGGLECA